MPELSYEEASKRVAENAKFPRITKEVIEGQIADTRFFMDGTTTICCIELRNGFKVFGHSTPADERNFDPLVGRGYARDNAFRQLWPLFGFMLREQIALREHTGIHIEYMGLEGVPNQPEWPGARGKEKGSAYDLEGYDGSDEPVERQLRKERENDA